MALETATTSILIPPLPESGETYASNVRAVLSVDADGKGEDVSIGWPERSRSKIHDHGKRKRNEEYQGSHGVTTVLWGKLYEWRLVDGEWIYREFSVGAILTEDPDTVHCVGSHTGAITHHRYEPPLTNRLTVLEENT